ncbi:unnamed protein product [Rotaria sp. Silwood2]|nr:unnamed protein product [Rotaria sp. Silwood2]
MATAFDLFDEVLRAFNNSYRNEMTLIELQKVLVNRNIDITDDELISIIRSPSLSNLFNLQTISNDLSLIQLCPKFNHLVLIEDFTVSDYLSKISLGTKLLTDDIITARFAKNSHYQSHQTSMASTKSSKSQHKSNEREHKKKKKNILGIGTSSPSISSTNLTLSPGRLSTDDDYDMKSSLSRRHNRTKTTNKSKRTRVK